MRLWRQARRKEDCVISSNPDLLVVRMIQNIRKDILRTVDNQKDT
jgi:hypothetical protein